jgi:hypothetical protein
LDKNGFFDMSDQEHDVKEQDSTTNATLFWLPYLKANAVII